jgi:hypothetical protein
MSKLQELLSKSSELLGEPELSGDLLKLEILALEAKMRADRSRMAGLKAKLISEFPEGTQVLDPTTDKLRKFRVKPEPIGWETGPAREAYEQLRTFSPALAQDLCRITVEPNLQKYKSFRGLEASGELEEIRQALKKAEKVPKMKVDIS